MNTAPSRAVLDVFGIEGDPIALAGGEGVTFRVGEVVVKRVHDAGETEWTNALLSRIEPDGYRVARPVPTTDGRWLHEGWSASRFIHGLRPAAPSWEEIAGAGLRFADAADEVREGGAEVLARRTHRWSIADRVAWGEADVALGTDAAALQQQIRSLLTEPASRDEHFVHGDLAGNVYFDPCRVPVILDVSPYLRPRRWAHAIVVADAVMWNGADVSLAASFATDAADRDLLGRALMFRLVAEQLADHPRHRAALQPYSAVLGVLR
jgi:uncharacterized protein (TIGR02569 family)